MNERARAWMAAPDIFGYEDERVSNPGVEHLDRSTPDVASGAERPEPTEDGLGTSVLATSAEATAAHSVVAALPPTNGAVDRLASFRSQAVKSHLLSMRESEVLRIAPPWASTVMIVISAAVLTALIASFIVRVEQTGTGRGVLRAPEGVQVVSAQTAGPLLELGAKSGDIVAAGALLARIDSTTTKTALLEAERQVDRAQEEVAQFLARRDKEQADRLRILQDRIRLGEAQARNQHAVVGRLDAKLRTYDRLLQNGLASPLDRAAVENERDAALGAALQLTQDTSAARLQISSIQADLALEVDQRKTAVAKAMDQRDILVYRMQQTEVRSPRAGRVEALVAKIGDNVSPGTPLARLVPEGAPRQVVAFLPEADRAFLQLGSSARVELDQLPLGEFGSLHATVGRVAADLARPEELTETMGATPPVGPVYRVELDLVDDEAVKKLDTMLRPGSLATVRFVLRKKIVATMLFEPLQRFFEE